MVYLMRLKRQCCALTKVDNPETSPPHLRCAKRRSTDEPAKIWSTIAGMLLLRRCHVVAHQSPRILDQPLYIFPRRSAFER